MCGTHDRIEILQIFCRFEPSCGLPQRPRRPRILQSSSNKTRDRTRAHRFLLASQPIQFRVFSEIWTRWLNLVCHMLDELGDLTMQSAGSKYMKHKLTLWQESFPRSSTPRISLCLRSPWFIIAMHFSMCLLSCKWLLVHRCHWQVNLVLTLIFIHMQRKMAPALSMSQATPPPNNWSPCKYLDTLNLK